MDDWYFVSSCTLNNGIGLIIAIQLVIELHLHRYVVISKKGKHGTVGVAYDLKFILTFRSNNCNFRSEYITSIHSYFTMQ